MSIPVSKSCYTEFLCDEIGVLILITRSQPRATPRAMPRRVLSSAVCRYVSCVDHRSENKYLTNYEDTTNAVTTVWHYWHKVGHFVSIRLRAFLGIYILLSLHCNSSYVHMRPRPSSSREPRSLIPDVDTKYLLSFILLLPHWIPVCKRFADSWLHSAKQTVSTWWVNLWLDSNGIKYSLSLIGILTHDSA